MNLTAFLVSHKVYFEFLKKQATRHATEASRVSGLALDEIVKTIVFVDQGTRPLIAIVSGDRNVSRHKLERCSYSKSVRLASDAEAEAATGYPPGGIPPVGHKKRLPVFLDDGLVHQPYLWCGGGARSKLVRLKTADVIKLSRATVCDIAIE
jgi:Cys-tRNA(Pro) deacylase